MHSFGVVSVIMGILNGSSQLLHGALIFSFAIWQNSLDNCYLKYHFEDKICKAALFRPKKDILSGHGMID